MTDERRAMLTERLFDALEAAIAGIVRDLGHDPHTSQVRAVVARNMRAVSGQPREARPQTIDAEIVSDEQVAQPVDF
jgi:hypothetical protein